MTLYTDALQTLQRWQHSGWIRAVDLQFGRFVAQQQPVQPQLVLLAALVSQQLAVGNVCLPLARLKVASDWPAELAAELDTLQAIDWQPDGLLLGQGLQATLLVMDQQRVYLYRYWQHEMRVYQALLQRTAPVINDRGLLQQHLDQLFDATDQQPDWQQVAAALALRHSLAVISGGPGTGKTTTVTKILALYISQQLAQGITPRIKLAAPTGKAAARLSESISKAKQQLALPDTDSGLIPDQASTLHRLLGVRQGSIEFKHDVSNPLHLDLLLVDEASMVDLPMMSRLLQALPEQSRLILLGDRDQLASVEAGSVLGDICAWPGALHYSEACTEYLNQQCRLGADVRLMPAEQMPPAIADCLAMLRHSYRFSHDSGIGLLARAVNQGQPADVRELLSQPPADLDYKPLQEDSFQSAVQAVVEFHSSLLKQGGTDSAEAFLEQLPTLQLLCALREGPFGVSGLNQRVREGLVARGHVRGESPWYRGRPVMITRNDARLGLYNGDIGVAWPDENGQIKVWFPTSQGLRGLLPSRLPAHDTVYAMTVHKSQGSEFDHVYLLLPTEAQALLSRELLYTGITRAKGKLTLVAAEKTLLSATQQPIIRWGGLAERLWGPIR
ncbi:exodeoxyribonuclease V subunit alpha [Pontibacter sp. JAM-7]|uniref:exodeoxyribonuclease V subunit alpha n=1 Tax=Pontibacter sp. JAM-7 TaxID=3366581 RepID=UPI003AF77D7F